MRVGGGKATTTDHNAAKQRAVLLLGKGNIFEKVISIRTDNTQI